MRTRHGSIPGLVSAVCLGSLAGAQGFAGAPLAAEPVEGVVAFESLRANAWTEPDGTQRLSLERDVRIQLAGYDLTAELASVWIAARPDLGPRHVQVFVYAEGVDTPLADAAVAVTAEDLRIQGVVRLAAPVAVGCDLVRPEPGRSEFDARAEAALDEAFAFASVEPVAPLADVPAAGAAAGAAIEDSAIESAATESLAAPRPRSSPIIEPEGYITLAAERVTRVVGDDADGEPSSIVLSGGVHAAYTIPGDDRVLELTAQRAVVFLSGSGGGDAGFGAISASSIAGIYLEGDVIATDAGYTLRGPRVYYDVERDKAIVLDAVFSTYDQSQGFPLYVRAASVRQISRGEFVADRARLSNTAFARPNITLGARTVTLTRPAPAEDDTRQRTIVDAKGITLNAGSTPVAWLPRFRGDPERIPLREVSFVNVTDSGGEVRTRWDALTLFGFESREDLDIDLMLDAMLERGPGVGFEAEWNRRGRRGGLLTYWVFNDTGTDVLSNGVRLERDGETRGIVRGEDIATLDEFWTLRTEVAHVTDPAFTDSFFENLAETGREFQTRAHLTRVEDNTIFTLEVAGQIDEFTPNEYLLQSQAYSVERFPEATYTRLADDALPGLPGRVTYTSQSRIGVLRLALNDETPAAYGFTSNARAQRAFGIDADTSFSDALGAQGYSEDARFRFDTRHELTADLDAGPVQVTPWITGRVTAYDDDFAEFGPGPGPGGGDEARVHFVSGVTASTTTQRVIDGVYSRALGVNRLRHLVTPSVTFFNAVTSVDQDELPVYDESVESLANGNALRLGLEQTLQTKRGGPGRWYSTDLLTLDAEVVFASDDSIGESTIGRYDPAQPELSRLSDFTSVSSTLQATDSVALVAGTIYDLENDRQSLTTAGILVDHHPGLRSSLRYRRLHDQDSTLLGAGLRYALSDKYDLDTNVTFDTEASELQSISMEVLRDFQSAVFGARVSYSNVSESTSVGVLFQPLGRGSAARVGGNPTSADDRSSPLGG